jgi:FMN phosphatase YigB (HAD superfamily)
MELAARAWYTLRQGFARRGELRQIHRDCGCPEITALTLPAGELIVLVLDFDGVLAPHGYPEPLPAVARLLDQWLGRPEVRRIYILSNKPTPVRERYFADHFPAIRFVRDVRKKPYPDSLAAIVAAERVPPHRVVVVDDRLLTGILAAVLAGTRAVPITKPYRDYAYHTCAELGFTLLRALERAFYGSGH